MSSLLVGEIMADKSERKKLSKKQIIIIVIASVLAVAVLAVVVVVPTLYSFGYIETIHVLNEPKDGQIRVACVGDSVTYGMGIQGWPYNAYPSVLGDLLGDGFCVNNYGFSGRCALSDADKPYKDEKLYKKSLDFAPDIVVIMLGSNDTKPHNWKGRDRYIRDFSALVDSYVNLPSNPTVYLVTPVPAFEVGGKVNYKIDASLIAHELRGAVKAIGAARGLNVIDMYGAFEGRADLFVDGVHPNADGAKLFARTVFNAITAA